ncbi:MAG: hypothetical protein GW947_01275 [Candidatus Pacebacteria bacterium]|nr:hypothetical protein [Candidatus Paceibacterota bacterium]PIR59573.1 MAG: hypothetical protein COU68_04850 [Candidatus Pacebacteria bacterium CG10_big_fil_rev_8_21_14_0_10_45_6]
MNRIAQQSNFYSKVIRFKFIKALQWRTEMILWILLDIFPFIILLFIWQSVLSLSASPSISLPELTVFYYLVILVQGFTVTHFEEYRPEEIRMGKIDFFLIKPYSFIQEIILNDIAGKLLYILMISPFLALLGYILWHLGLFAIPALTTIHVLVFVCLLLLAYILQFCLSLLITMTAFWFEEAQGLSNLKILVISLFSGTLIPFALLPEWLQKVTNAQPLKFLFAVPIRLIQEQALPTAQDWSMLFGTLAFLIGTIFLLWQRGIQKYSSAGG